MIRTTLAHAILWGLCGPLLGCAWLPHHEAAAPVPSFSFDCDNTAERPCPVLVASVEGRRIELEPSSVVWSEAFGRAFFVTDNGAELAKIGAGHFVISSFALDADAREVEVTPLLSPEQGRAFPLYDLESVVVIRDRLYAMGSLSLHPTDPQLDHWERNQFVQMDLIDGDGGVEAIDLTHVARRWPDFRDWLVSESGHPFLGEEIRGRAEEEGINVESLCATPDGKLLMGFRGPGTTGDGALVLEVELPPSPDHFPAVIATHVIPRVTLPGIPKDTSRTLRAMTHVLGAAEEYYVVLGPQGREKEALILARWNRRTGELSQATLLPYGIVAEGIAQLPGGRLLIVDDLGAALLIATEYGPAETG